MGTSLTWLAPASELGAMWIPGHPAIPLLLPHLCLCRLRLISQMGVPSQEVTGSLETLCPKSAACWGKGCVSCPSPPPFSGAPRLVTTLAPDFLSTWAASILSPGLPSLQLASKSSSASARPPAAACSHLVSQAPGCCQQKEIKNKVVLRVAPSAAGHSS